MLFDRFDSLLFRNRLTFVLCVIALTGIAGLGLARLEFNDNLADFFKAENSDYRALLRFFDDFGADDTSCVVVLSADEWFCADNASWLRRFTNEAAQVPGVANVYSILDVRRAIPGTRRMQRPLVPGHDATADSFAQARATALKHPLVEGQLLSKDGKTTLVVVKFRGRDLPVGKVQPSVDALEDVLDHVSQGSEVRVGLTGLPRLRVDIYYAIQRDQMVFLLIGALLAISIAFLLFRRSAAMLIVCVGPLLGTVWTLGTLGLVGEPINTFNSILPSLVMVIGFTDSVHFMVEIRRLQNEGQSPRQAAQNALRHLFLPCALTSITTAIGFGSLMVAEMDVIQRFGAACAGGAILNFLAVVTLVPLMASTRLGRHLTSGANTSMEERT